MLIFSKFLAYELMKASSSFLGTLLARMLREQYCLCRIDIPRVCNYPECVIEEITRSEGPSLSEQNLSKQSKERETVGGTKIFFAIEKTPEPMLKTNF